jgi:hypothetical protein
MRSLVRLASLALAAALAAGCATSSAAVTPPDETARALAAARAATPEPEPTATPTEAPIATPEPTPAPTPRWDTLPVAATDAVALAQQLATTETALRDPKITGAQLAWYGHLQQLSYGRLVDYPEWKDIVFAALPESTRNAVIGSLDAGRYLRNMSGPTPKTLPDWKIVEPAPIEELLGYYQEAQDTFGVAWYYLAAIHLVETRMGRIRGLSTAGAQGPMQFIPSTWKIYGKGDVNDDHDAILAAARYLKAAGAPGNMEKALYAYNHSISYVNALLEYAAVMKADPAAYRGYHGWNVYYPTKDGPVLLPIGWTKE